MGHASDGKEAHEEPRAMPAMRQECLPLPEEEVRQLRVPGEEDEELQLVQEVAPQALPGHWPHAVLEDHASPLQEQLPRRHHTSSAHEESLSCVRALVINARPR